jgi:hypothetical protein
VAKSWSLVAREALRWPFVPQDKAAKQSVWGELCARQVEARVDDFDGELAYVLGTFRAAPGPSARIEGKWWKSRGLRELAFSWLRVNGD